ncbi:hypothetical protein [Paenibacillus sediminis]|uniref:Uncharacterized protein n=1 Tax=Paenibacillus sediminis TaxID=664909 RepID=A0ABS4H5C8_9BACL|nr:hypothetical protein [Paenibacillus sediminis]MBP1937587.1 hypothetical protein [Paenibacillus sediminis]
MKGSFLLSRHQNNLFKHPHFGHTITDDCYGHQLHPLSLHGPVIHVIADIIKVHPDAEAKGSMHHHFFVMIKQIISIKGSDPSIVNLEKEHFVAVRYGDHLGIPKPIQGLEAGQSIELQGEYIDENHVYITPDNREGEPCIHFTHRPVGFVIYHGEEYE